MKMSKTILPALAMLLVSAVMLSTASFAWFALSEEVDATGMNVSIKSDSLYLLIAPVDEETAGAEADLATATLSAQDVKDYNKTTVTGQPIGVTDIYPAAYYFGSFGGGDDDQKKVTSGANLKDPSYWYTAEAASPDASGMITGSDEPLTSFNGYVVRYRYYVVLDTGSNPMDTLKVSDLSISLPNPPGSGTHVTPVRVVVACGNQMEEFSQGDVTGDVDLTGDASLDDQIALEIILYVYYDGNDSTVTTNDVAAISDADITFTFKAENSATSEGN